MKNQVLLRLVMIPMIFTLLAEIMKVSAESSLTKDYNRLFLLVTVVSVIVAALVIALWAYFIYKYREGSDTERKEIDHAQARKLEITWTVVAVVIIIFLMIFSYPVLFRIDADTQNRAFDEEIIIEGTAGWQWVFYYQDGTITRPDVKIENGFAIAETTLNLDVGKVYKFIFWSSGGAGAVIHSFFVPELNFKSDVTPGRNNTIIIEITKSGEFPILCAEFCGFGHSGMRGLVIAS